MGGYLERALIELRVFPEVRPFFLRYDSQRRPFLPSPRRRQQGRAMQSRGKYICIEGAAQKVAGFISSWIASTTQCYSSLAALFVTSMLPLGRECPSLSLSSMPLESEERHMQILMTECRLLSVQLTRLPRMVATTPW